MNFSVIAQELIKAVSENGRNKDVLMSAAIGAAIASRMQLPSSEIENFNIWYRSMCQIDVMSEISKVNEAVLIDTDMVHECVKSFLSTRLAAAFPPKAIVCSRNNALCRLVGISNNISQAIQEAIDSNGFTFSLVYNKVNAFLQEKTEQ